MLQQTQVARVIGPFGRFIRRFPDASSCAGAGPAEVIRAWDGLGFNRRAVNLYRSAVAIVEDHDGLVPEDLASLLALPGIGPYSARAVLCFAFEGDTGVVDTNVVRILARAVAGHPLGASAAQSLADALVPPGGSWAFNQSLFDIGSRYCTKRQPTCQECPLRSRCRWARLGRVPIDPASPGFTRQSRFEGSDRQGRGRLVTALRRGPVHDDQLASSAGWESDAGRARDVAESLVAGGLAVWDGSSLTLA